MQTSGVIERFVYFYEVRKIFGILLYIGNKKQGNRPTIEVHENFIIYPY